MSARTSPPSRRSSHLHGILLCVLALVCSPACFAQFSGPGPAVQTPTTATVTTDRALLFPAVREPQLAPGDLISIHVFEQADYASDVRLSADGTVVLPLIGTVQLSGLTLTQAERLLEQRLKDAGIYRNPQVTIQLTQGPNQQATVAGEVHAVVPIVGSRRLLDVLAVAGGLPATASHVITISRPGVPEPLVVDLGTDPLRSSLANIPIFPGDTVIVSHIGMVYMVGDFKTPGTIQLTQYAPLTLMQATALSGGLAYQGKYNDVRLIRTVGDHRTVVKVNIQRILHGKDPDPILQANDIVFLPDDFLKSFIANGNLGTLFGVVSLLITFKNL
ncbi:MAG TPA: polysaccharide biosynthesis/export family protein [Bryocella sp.]|nr:polysaccharide biosynthesis/export family protein [Bryocella sp.]